MEKSFKKQQNDPKLDEFIMKVDVKRFGWNNLLQDFNIVKSYVRIEKKFDEIAREKKVLFHRTSITILITLFMNLKP